MLFPETPIEDEVVDAPAIALHELKTYKLHGHAVVKFASLPQSFEIPADIKRYKRRGEPVVR
ncbi:hypothetical protein IQ249_25425 [Lusitaniella coriacea LEGE 07157]|uniref:Uncharacterized protein n=1 Tax=Lusitaniella coriacea LEGE 07157 TaxID=945747 RepID=A0A8J7E151_9CYAN|nr:hypothetical protein [Lusitaniella coriacea]MBE9119195.1 hypothetical protein [Lusitaniella coriacea LEGE 07157]